jgi:hypothetical protein
MGGLGGLGVVGVAVAVAGWVGVGLRLLPLVRAGMRVESMMGLG